MPRHKIKKLVLFCAAYILLGFSNLAIKLLPFKTLMRMSSNSDKEYIPSLTAKTRSRIGAVKQAVFSAGRYTPWRSKCFEQALTAGFLLRLSGISHAIYFGLNRDGDALHAHAWVTAGKYLVTGYSVNIDFKAVSAFYYISKKDRARYV